jgi:hypothetical protein
MTVDDYVILKDWAESVGYKLNPSVEYRIVDGIGGMYAIDDIPANSILYTGPPSVLDEYTNSKISPNYYMDIIKEYQLGDDSKINKMFLAFESIEFFKENSIYYATDDELELLGVMSNSVMLQAKRYISKLDNTREWIKERMPDTSDDTIMYILLNSESRSWSDGGFSPILDLFNHSHMKGSSRIAVSTHGISVLGAKVDYKAGDQVYDSYGVRDMYQYVQNYCFFDSSDWHYSNIISRLDFPLKKEVDIRRFDEVKKHFEVVTFNDGTSEKFKILDADIFITDMGPSHKLVKLVDIFSETNDAKNHLSVYLEWFDVFINSINLKDVVEVTPRLVPYYNAIQKELAMLQYCKRWAVMSNVSLPTHGTENVINNLVNRD